MRAYYEHGGVTIYHGDCREVLADLAETEVLLATDPPYPNNAGHFDAAVPVARRIISEARCSEALIFWSELEQPPCRLPLVAVHIWHRSNVNGRPYEPVYHFAADGRKRRSDVGRFPAIFDGAGPGCHEFAGHPTQKPVVLMRWLLEKTAPATVLDPFAGVGATLIAAKQTGRRAIGIEIEERYCEIAARRLQQEVLPIFEPEPCVESAQPALMV